MIDNAQPDTIVRQPSGTFTEIDAPRPGASNRIELNSSKAPFDDARVREAFIRSANVDDGVEPVLRHGRALVLRPVQCRAARLVGPETLRLRPEAANALLDEAGWTESDADGYRVKNGERSEPLIPGEHQPVDSRPSSRCSSRYRHRRRGRFRGLISAARSRQLVRGPGSNDYNVVSAPYTKVGPDVLRILYHSAGITRRRAAISPTSPS